MSDPPPRDEAVSRRLRRLASMPVDTSRLDAALRRALPGAPARLRVTPLRALAAALLLGVALGLAFAGFGSGAALASAERLADIHRSAVAGNERTTPVASIAEARAALRRKWPDTPELPELPEHRAISCCVHEIGRRQMACITFEIDGVPVTLALAGARDIRMPHGESRRIDGAEYIVGESGGIHMVMQRRGSTWLCLMGRLSTERLAEVARSLEMD